MSSGFIHIRDGVIQNPKTIKALFHDLTDGRYLVEIKKKNIRTLPQNKYYWLMLTEYIQPALYNEGWREIKTKEDAHEFVSELFLKTKIANEVTGEMRERIKSTTELSTIEFNVYLEEIWQWSAEFLSINIPEPNQKFELWENSPTE